MENHRLLVLLAPIRGWVHPRNRRDAERACQRTRGAPRRNTRCHGSGMLKWTVDDHQRFREMIPEWMHDAYDRRTRHARACRTRMPRQLTVTSACAWRIDASKSTKGASKLRRDLINAEIANLRDLLPLPPSTRQRLSQLQLMALVCVFLRKANYFQQGTANGELAHAFKILKLSPFSRVSKLRADSFCLASFYTKR